MLFTLHLYIVIAMQVLVLKFIMQYSTRQTMLNTNQLLIRIINAATLLKTRKAITAISQVA